MGARQYPRWVLALLPDFLDAEHLIDTFGLLGIWAIVFAESGLLIGFFLPGDALLFTAGFLASGPSSFPESLHLPLLPLVIGIWIAAIVGDQVGYVFGQRVGPALFRRPDSRFFKQANVDKAHEFFEKHGPRAIVLARFVPIVRTFTPITAGVSRDGLPHLRAVERHRRHALGLRRHVARLLPRSGRRDRAEPRARHPHRGRRSPACRSPSSCSRRTGRSGTPWSATWRTTSSSPISASWSTRPATPTASSRASA